MARPNDTTTTATTTTATEERYRGEKVPIVIKPVPTPRRRYEHFERLPQLEALDAAARAAGQPLRLRRSGKAAIGTMHVIQTEDGPMHLTVRPRSGAPSAPFCITHGESFESTDALAEHCRDDRDHVVAWFCADKVVTNENMDPLGSRAPVKITYGLESDEPWSS